MNTMKTFVAISTMLCSCAASSTGAQADFLERVTAYKPLAPFTYEVADMRFVGYFLQSPDRCDVTVRQERADGEAASTPVRQVKLLIAAGGRAELPAGPDSVLAIACNTGAGVIRIAPHSRGDQGRAVVQ